jgi:hypothetical protein
VIPFPGVGAAMLFSGAAMFFSGAAMLFSVAGGGGR